MLEVSSGMILAILKQGISAVLACSVKGATQNLISHALADPAVHSSLSCCAAFFLLQLACIEFLPYKNLNMPVFCVCIVQTVCNYFCVPTVGL